MSCIKSDLYCTRTKSKIELTIFPSGGLKQQIGILIFKTHKIEQAEKQQL